jgi:hypothetical protein
LIEPSTAELIERLAKLRDRDLLSADEFEIARGRILAPGKYWKTAAIGSALLSLALAFTLLFIWVGWAPPASSGFVDRSVSAPPELRSLLQFEDPITCTPRPPLEAIFGSMARWDPGSRRMVAGEPIPVRALGTSVTPTLERTPNQFGGFDFMARLPFEGLWWSLEVRELRVTGREESDANQSWQIVFRDDPLEVETVLNEQGWQVPRVGKWRTNHGTDPTVGLQSVEGGTAVICSF